MTDLDPEIWNNPTLGSVGAGPFLPEVEAQAAEDRNARLEGREPRVVEYVHRYPTLPPSVTVPSNETSLVYVEPSTPVAEEDGVSEDDVLGFLNTNE